LVDHRAGEIPRPLFSLWGVVAYICVTILSWKKINPKRSDVINPSWFKFKHKLFDDPDFYDFTKGEIVFWLYLLCEVSKQNRGDGTAIICHDRVEVLSRVGQSDVKTSLNKLKQKHIIDFKTLRRRNVDVTQTREEKIREEKIRVEKTKSSEGVSNETKPSGAWVSYSIAYEKRYGTKPVRNATINSQLSGFVKRIGIEEAPMVAEFYLTHNDAFYLKSMHPVGLLLKDAEKLRTEWVTGKKMTNTSARLAETRSVTVDAVKSYYDKKHGANK